MDRVLLRAPLSGILVPIEEVPDPVFAQKMVGDGISIDPVDTTLVAPCGGRVIQLHSAAHAVTIASDHGLEVLMHIGLDTVQLKGRGFTPRVKVGDQVREGDPLIEFEADYVATHAKSLLTQVVITTLDRVASMTRSTGTVVAGKDTILAIAMSGGSATLADAIGDAIKSDPIVITNPSGLHARPAAVLASHAKAFTADVRLWRGETSANTRSVVAIMGMEIGKGETVRLVGTGQDAAQAIESLSRLIREGLGESPDAVPAPTPERVVRATTTDPNVLTGVPASPGVAVGNVVQVRHESLRVIEDANDPRQERRALDGALEQAKAELDALQARLRADGAADKAAIFAAHREVLDDPDLLEIAGSAIGRGKSAAFGWQRAFMQHADQLARLKNELLAARANDLRDVGRRVLAKLTGVEATTPEYPTNTILVAEELTPSDTANINRAQVLGFATTTGGAASHVAILARSLDIPLVAGINPSALDLPNGTPVILDGTQGTLRLNPSTSDIARIHDRQERHARQRRAEQERAHEPAVTADGYRLEIAANIGGVADAQQAVALGGEAIGLLRSEFLFLHRSTAPTELEQETMYVDVVRALGPKRRVVIRALDVGGDKPLPYLPIPREDNPFLGERGIRVLLNHPELFRTQLRAILRASRSGFVSIMFPMIATMGEWRNAREILEEERQRMGVPPIEAGIMVEVASAAVLADQFAKEVDFFSIGTNDLTQYTLAMDRGHPRLAPHVDGLSPAVLRLIAQTVAAAKAHGRWTGVCGGIASDPQAVPLLVGMGIEELSVSVPVIPAIKAQIRRLRLEECRALATAALDCVDAAEVRALVPVEQV
jgi:multiphosphoryl transfer protein